MEIKWILSVPTTKNALNIAENYYQVVFPKEYKEIVLQYNRAVPRPCCVYTNGKERVFARLLSINTDDKMNIYNFSEIIDMNKERKMIAFGEDPFGNLWCFDYSDGNSQPCIVFWNHEMAHTISNYNPDFVSDSFQEFLNGFQESQD